MRAVRTPLSTNIYALPGGNEDNYLYVQETGGEIRSDWELNDAERALLAGGGRVALTIIGALVPPVILSVVRPFCRECKAEMEWDESTQAYACTCEASEAPSS